MKQINNRFNVNGSALKNSDLHLICLIFLTSKPRWKINWRGHERTKNIEQISAKLAVGTIYISFIESYACISAASLYILCTLFFEPWWYFRIDFSRIKTKFLSDWVLGLRFDTIFSIFLKILRTLNYNKREGNSFIINQAKASRQMSAPDNLA